MGQVAAIHSCVLLLLLGTSLASRDAFLQTSKGSEAIDFTGTRRVMQQSGSEVTCRVTQGQAFLDGSFAAATTSATGAVACTLVAFTMVVRDTYRKGNEYRTHAYTLSGNFAFPRDGACGGTFDEAGAAQYLQQLITEVLTKNPYQRRSSPFDPKDICTPASCSSSNQWQIQSVAISDTTAKETSCCASDGCNTGSEVKVSNADGGKKKSNAGAIAGGVIGGIAGLGIIAGVVIFFVRRNRNKAGAPHGAATGGDAIKEYGASKAAMGMPQQHYAGMVAQPVPAQQFYQTQGQQPGVMMVPANNMQHQQMPMQHMPMQQH